MLRNRLIPLFSVVAIISSALSSTGHSIPSASAYPFHGVKQQQVQPISIDTTQTNDSSFEGFGVEDIYPSLWNQDCPWDGNPFVSHQPDATQILSSDYGNYLLPRLVALNPTFVRIFIDLNVVAPSAGTYTWDSPGMEGLYLDLQGLQAAGISAMFTIHRIPAWIDPGHTFPQNAAEAKSWAQVVTALLQHLYGKDGSGYHFSNVRYVGGPNELESDDKGDNNTTLSQVAQAFNDLDGDLQIAGLRSDVALFGPDKDNDGGAVQGASQDPTLGRVLDIYDFHSYFNVSDIFDTDYFDRQVHAAAAHGKQLWETELGFKDGGITGDNWTWYPPAVIQALNHGVAAMAFWGFYGACYSKNNDPGGYSLLGNRASGFQMRPGYYMWKDLSAHVAAHSIVYRNSCDRANCQDLFVAALNDQRGHDTIFVAAPCRIIGFGDCPTTPALHFTYVGAAPNETLKRCLLDPAKVTTPTSGSEDEVIAMRNGIFSDSLPTGGFAVYTSLNVTLPQGASGPYSLRAFARRAGIPANPTLSLRTTANTLGVNPSMSLMTMMLTPHGCL